MLLKDYRETYYTFTGKASDINRQLAFAAIAVIWLFKRDVSGVPSVPPPLILPGALVVLALAVDLLQYLLGAIIWYCFYRSKEKAGIPENRDIDHSPWLERPITALFWVKVACTITAYYFIFLFLLNTWLGIRL
jgi:hypothetical protein